MGIYKHVLLLSSLHSTVEVLENSKITVWYIYLLFKPQRNSVSMWLTMCQGTLLSYLLHVGAKCMYLVGCNLFKTPLKNFVRKKFAAGKKSLGAKPLKTMKNNKPSVNTSDVKLKHVRRKLRMFVRIYFLYSFEVKHYIWLKEISFSNTLGNFC